MVLGVAGDGVDEGAHCDGHLARGADAGPCLGRQGTYQRHRGGADGAELFDVAGPGASVRRGVGGELLLVEAGQGRLGAAGEPEGSKAEDALSVVDVIERFAVGPLAGIVTVEGTVFGDGGEVGEKFSRLSFEVGENIAGLGLVDVGEIVRGRFGTLRSSDHSTTIAHRGISGFSEGNSESCSAVPQVNP